MLSRRRQIMLAFCVVLGFLVTLMTLAESWVWSSAWRTPWVLWLNVQAAWAVTPRILGAIGLSNARTDVEWRWASADPISPGDRIEVLRDARADRFWGQILIAAGLPAAVICLALLLISPRAGGLVDPFGPTLGFGVAMFLMLVGMIRTLRDNTTPLITADADGLRTPNASVAWSRIASCGIRTRRDVLGDISGIDILFHDPQRQPLPLHVHLNAAPPDDREPLLARLRTRFPLTCSNQSS